MPLLGWKARVLPGFFLLYLGAAGGPCNGVRESCCCGKHASSGALFTCTSLGAVVPLLSSPSFPQGLSSCPL